MKANIRSTQTWCSSTYIDEQYSLQRAKLKTIWKPSFEVTDININKIQGKKSKGVNCLKPVVKFKSQKNMNANIRNTKTRGSSTYIDEQCRLQKAKLKATWKPCNYL
jgi:hypothetical protein